MELVRAAGKEVVWESAWMSGDFERLRQIMINLVSNGIKFTNEGEVIVNVGIDTDKDGGMSLSVSVADSMV